MNQLHHISKFKANPGCKHDIHLAHPHASSSAVKAIFIFPLCNLHWLCWKTILEKKMKCEHERNQVLWTQSVYIPVCLWESCLPSHTGNHHSSASVVYNLQHWTNSAHGFLVWQAVALRSLLLGCLYPQAPRKQLCYRPETMRNLYRNKVRHIPF